MGLNILKKIAKMSLELLGLLLELLLELLLLLMYAFYHVLILGREAPPCNYVINAYNRSSSSSSSSSNSSPSSSNSILATFCKMFTHLAQSHLAFSESSQNESNVSTHCKNCFVSCYMVNS